ncbi:ABC transporter ATP-binding protein [Algirhabdus cladophorae]|uniref:ABC transporter ATP-binding protein n=1 Tax=Algirhabdus cladophorae TaxID=3377108 RepID=UPI003B848829
MLKVDDTPFIRIENVTKSFGDVVAVDDISLEIRKNELFCLLGGSGCGKTTLLRMLAGFETPTSGRIFIDGVDMSTTPAHARPTNMMFQSYALFPHMSVAKNIAYGLLRDGVAKSEVNDRVAQMLKLVQLGDFGKRKPAQLSGGQRQRVALARALIKRPKVLLLDEPLGALDKKLREQTQFELVNIQESLGITFIVVTHDQEEAMTLSSRIGVMNKGQIAQVGTPRQVYEAPQTRFVADFIGSINVLETMVVGIDGPHMFLQSQMAPETLKVPLVEGLGLTDNCWYAVRPEKLSIGTTSDASDMNIEGVVEDIAYLGGQSIYHVKLTDGQIIKVAQSNRTRRDRPAITWEDKVFLGIDAGDGVVLQR